MEYSITYDREYLIDINGNPIDKTPRTNPYDYDSFVIFKYSNFDKNKDKAVDTDRLAEWNPDLYNDIYHRLYMKYGRNPNFIFRNRSSCSEFMSRYYNKNIEVTAVVQNCNVSNGYPYWTIYYKEI